MMMGIQASFGDVSVTMQATADEYQPMVIADMGNQCRDQLLAIIAAIPDADEDGADDEQVAAVLSHYQAMRRDLLQEDE